MDYAAACTRVSGFGLSQGDDSWRHSSRQAKTVDATTGQTGQLIYHAWFEKVSHCHGRVLEY
jgi:hypothetical protein